MNKRKNELYLPGKCNIGPKEIRKRYLVGAIGFMIAAILLFLLSFFKAGYALFIITILPFILGFIGFYQGHEKFCIGNAIAGVYDFSGNKGKRSHVNDRISHMKDIKKAVLLLSYSIVSAAIITFIFVLLAYYGVI